MLTLQGSGPRGLIGGPGWSLCPAGRKKSFPDTLFTSVPRHMASQEPELWRKMGHLERAPTPDTLTFPQGTSNYGTTNAIRQRSAFCIHHPISLSNHHWCQAMTPSSIIMFSTFKPGTRSKSWPVCIGVGMVLKALFV